MTRSSAFCVHSDDITPVCVSFSYDCLRLNVIMEMRIVGWMRHERRFNRFSRVNFFDERSSESRGC